MFVLCPVAELLPDFWHSGASLSAPHPRPQQLQYADGQMSLEGVQPFFQHTAVSQTGNWFI